ncbi:MAG: CRISPR-associated helicase Cas3, partial [Pseudomonadota bacterium]
LESACGHELGETHLSRLTVLAGLHDAGKALNGFQERITGRSRGTSHLAELLAALQADRRTQAALRVDLLSAWFSDPSAALVSAVCHHGGPVRSSDINASMAQTPGQLTVSADGYDPLAEMQALMAELLARFPEALAPAIPIRWTASLDHLFAGLVMGADWLGSSLSLLGPDWRPAAVKALLDTLPWGEGYASADPLSILPGTPLGAQTVILDVPVSERLVLVEAPTGTGKTETAILRALQLIQAGAVDGFYFAVPTRSAATELHARVARLVTTHSPALAGKVVRAVPGLLDTDPWQLSSTPSWTVACPKRVMFAPAIVGTIDQAMLSVMRTKHAWMRHAALSRHLLIVDEVHASDPYMTEVVRSLVRRHLDLGCHALLMSATLGESMRAELQGRPRLDFKQAAAVTYPAVNDAVVAAPAAASQLILEDYASAMSRLRDCVLQGGCALMIRSTVSSAIATYQELQAAGVPAMLHHSRFADVDRRFLDARLVGILGKGGSRTPMAIIATQTAEQSLDIDADLLISAPAPADVLLQRRGRLGRHRPEAVLPFVILEPTEIDSIAQAALRNARGQFGRMPSGGDWGYVYDVISTLATIDALRGKDHICIPNDVRTLVEIATHPDYLSEYANRKGWSELYSATWGTRISQRQRAQGVLVDWQRPYLEQPVDERVVTRLGDGTVTIELDRPFISPISGEEVKALPVPYRWVRDMVAGTVGVVVEAYDGVFRISVDRVILSYSLNGFIKVANSDNGAAY